MQISRPPRSSFFYVIPATLFAALFMFFIAGCTGAKYMFPTLVNRGILPLSTTNAYQGSNLFLAKELEKSSYLFRFLETRGAPDAIEILEENPGHPELYLYYTADNSVYIGDLRADERNRQWIVRGPYGIDRHHYRLLNEERNALVGEPVFDLYGSPYRFTAATDPRKMAKRLEPEIPYLAAPSPTPEPSPSPEPTPEEEEEAQESKQTSKEDFPRASPFDYDTRITADIPDLNDRNFIPKNTDQKALLLAQGYAPRSQNGDILHRVRHKRDTLSVIVEWYTGSRDNYAAVMKYNKIDDSKPLKKGTVVKIPLSMIERTKLLPDD